jgi:hypothetical protein
VSIQKCFLANISFAKLITESDSKEDIGDDDKDDQDFLSDVHLKKIMNFFIISVI